MCAFKKITKYFLAVCQGLYLLEEREMMFLFSSLNKEEETNYLVILTPSLRIQNVCEELDAKILNLFLFLWWRELVIHQFSAAVGHQQ